jgi:hypothetical protein
MAGEGGWRDTTERAECESDGEVGWAGGWLEGSGGVGEGLPISFTHSTLASGMVAHVGPVPASVAGEGEVVRKGGGFRGRVRQVGAPVLGLAACAGVVLVGGSEAKARMLLIKVGGCVLVPVRFCMRGCALTAVGVVLRGGSLSQGAHAADEDEGVCVYVCVCLCMCVCL